LAQAQLPFLSALPENQLINTEQHQANHIRLAIAMAQADVGYLPNQPIQADMVF
jgi:hypothetical protein